MRVQYPKLRNLAHTTSLSTFSLLPKDQTFIFYSLSMICDFSLCFAKPECTHLKMFSSWMSIGCMSVSYGVHWFKLHVDLSRNNLTLCNIHS